MKKSLKEQGIIFIILLFIVLLFKKNMVFKTCILQGCFIFFENVFPFLFPMFLINDLLMNYHFDVFITYTIHPLFKKLFHFSPIVSSIFVLSLFSGTPTNAYLITNLVKQKALSKKDACITLSYSFFLNPLFLYSTFLMLFQSTWISIKLIGITYGLNFLFAFFFRFYPYEQTDIQKRESQKFSLCLTNSLKKTSNTLLLVLGTILFYLFVCEAFSLLLKNPLINCIGNGILEATGGLFKLKTLNFSRKGKEILALFFVSFGGFSIHSQIKNIIDEEEISYRPFLIVRCLHAFLAALIGLIIP